MYLNPLANTATDLAEPAANTTAAAVAALGLSPDAQAQRRAELLALLSQTVPEVMADQQVNIDLLKELLGHERIAPDEHYELSWAGKAAARREIQKNTTHTLQPAASNPAQAGHMLIEGENLEVLRVLQKSYRGKVKMIYIDPPYNTGNDSFVYPDDYSETLDAYQKRTGEKNEAGHLNKQSLWKKNSKESGQYHSAWLSMMYPRLYLARNLLRDDGVIFISIDDNEAANLKLLCDEVFGSENYVANFIWKKRTGSNDAKNMASIDHDYVFSYCKNSNIFTMNGEEKDFSSYSNPDNDPMGSWMKDNLTCNKTASERPNLYYPITDTKTGVIYQCNPNRVWAYERSRMSQIISVGKVIFPKNGIGSPAYKRHSSELRSDKNPFSSLLDVPINTVATRELRQIMEGQFFDFPKSVGLISKLIFQGAFSADSIVMDFFSGSGTMAHAVMALNLKVGGNRQSISVQMPEVLDKSSEAYKVGYRKRVNVLTVIPNESYETFAKSLQQEIEEETGVSFVNRVKNARAKARVSRKSLSAEEEALFSAIWQKISFQTRYRVALDTPRLVAACLAALSDMNQYPRVQPAKIRSQKAKMVMTADGVHGVQTGVDETRASYTVAVPDVYGYIQNRVHLSRSSIFAILDSSGRLGELLVNPQGFLDLAISAIKTSLQALLVEGIQYYEVGGKRYEMTLLDEPLETYLSSIYPPAEDGMTTPVSKTVLQAQPLDDSKAAMGEAFACVLSDSEVESRFAHDCSLDERVKFFFKLPSRFKIPTPLGNYNPDWAVVFEDDARVYFVAETKSSNVEADRRQSENLKIKCGRKHFELSKDVVFKDVTELRELLLQPD